MLTENFSARRPLALAGFVVFITLVCLSAPRAAAQQPEAKTVNLDHPAVAFSPADPTLLIRGISEIRVNGQTLFSLGAEAGGHVIWFFSPRYGRFIFSTRQHPRYKFQQVDVVNNCRIVFDSGGDRFEWILGKPLVESGSIAQLWMMHDKFPEPLKELQDPGGIIGSASHYEYLFDS